MSIGLHFGWNVFQNSVVGLPNGGKPSQATLLVFEQTGPISWTGGAFGPEGGGVVSMVLLFGLMVRTIWIGRQRALATALADPPAAMASSREY